MTKAYALTQNFLALKHAPMPAQARFNLARLLTAQDITLDYVQTTPNSVVAALSKDGKPWGIRELW